ncbi:MAG: molybdopterin molybdotransferase MoeA [Candidatus Eisenbacteria bacterium]|nr:molybdopterin molybdotransferase MoeA [Candidatus Eisenbacteria bacterium]
MIPFEEAIRIVDANTDPLEQETLPLIEAAGRVLAEAIAADRDLPPFHRSERDGWAVRSADFRGGRADLCLLESILWAGRPPDVVVGPGECARIMTGAPLPEGADAVAMVEMGTAGDGRVRIDEPEMRAGLYVHPRGIDARRGDVAVGAGTTLDPHRVVLAASVGAAQVAVRRPVRVAYVGTGDEVIGVEETPAPTHIREGNGPGLRALIDRTPWLAASSFRRAPDDREVLTAAISAALEEADALVMSGGVSMGRRDLVPDALGECGVRRLFHKVAIRPGKPCWFGRTAEGKPVFALPGNPVSFQVTFREIALRGLRRMAGFADPSGPSVRIPLAAGVERLLPLRFFLPARLIHAGGVTAVEALDNHGSGDFVTASRGDGVIMLPDGPIRLAEGVAVDFHPWRYSW